MSNARSSRTPTITDVAREAGVSVSTAARVLRGAAYPVRPVLQKRVRRVAERIGYVPNLIARKLRGGESAFIGLVAGHLLDPFFGEIAEAVTEEANARSLLAIVSNMQRDPRLEIQLCQRLWEHRVAGLILTGGGFDQWTHNEELAALVKKIRKSGVIVVSLAERKIGVPTFSVDNEVVGRTLAEQVLQLGHREIGVAIGPARSYATQRRLRAMRAALAAAGLKATELHTEYGVAAGTAAIDRLLDLNPRLTAVIGGADTLALGVIERLNARGIRVPQDVSVVGLGNTAYAGVAIPRLTTLDVSVAACGAAAVRYIDERLAGGKLAVPDKFAIRLVTGASLARCSRPQESGRRTRRRRPAMTAETQAEAP